VQTRHWNFKKLFSWFWNAGFQDILVKGSVIAFVFLEWAAC
jgi:hypothetical protein